MARLDSAATIPDRRTDTTHNRDMSASVRVNGAESMLIQSLRLRLAMIGEPAMGKRWAGTKNMSQCKDLGAGYGQLDRCRLAILGIWAVS